MQPISPRRDTKTLTAAFAAVLGLALALAAGAQQALPTTPGKSPAPAPLRWDTYSDTWAGTYVGTDGKRHPLPMYEDVGPPKADKSVGVFYFLWVDGRSGVVNDNNLALAKDPAHVFPLVKGAWHWWAEPLLGYYLITDPYVLRKHAQMLQDAGVDTLAFDSTNAYLHEEQYAALSKVYEDIRRDGQGTPQFFHVTNAQSGKTVQKVYEEVYSRNLNPDLWFRWLGKPLILAHPADMSPQMTDYFTTRYSWAYAEGSGGWFKDGHDKWPWILTYPQAFGWHAAPDVPEETSVAVAHHAHTNRGRSLAGTLGPDGRWQEHEPDAAHQQPGLGIQFALQSAQALKINPPFVFVTGWNEWIAPAGGSPGRKFLGHVLTKNDAFFVDEYSPEYSRDLEPMSPDAPNSFGDNYYYDLVNFVRRYKGVRPLPAVTPRPIKINGAFAQWQAVGPEFRDDIGDPAHRDFDGFAKGSHYTNTSGRNDIVAAKVSFDAKNLYFYVRTHAKLTPHTDPDWMLLYLNTDSDDSTGWMGYDYVINRHAGANTTTLERSTGAGYQWQTVGEVKYHAQGNELVIAVPRVLLGAKALPASIDFKWADHCFAKGDWSDFTLNGDAAPNDRFNYRAKLGR